MMNTSKSPLRRYTAMAAGLVAGVAFAALTYVDVAQAADAPAAGAAGPAVTRRVSAEQYRTIIHDIFGSNIKLGGRFEPDVRESGLLAVGSSRISVTPSGIEQYDSMARTIASQVVDEEHRGLLIPCKPANPAEADAACTTQFLTEAGQLLYRRPLTQEELQAQVAAAATGAKTLKGFYPGLGLALSNILVSPQFLFRKEVAEADPDHAGQYRLTAYSKASQLSFYLWNSAPDRSLLAAAASGEIHTEKGLAKQVDRMLASSRVEAGLRAFFTDMLGFDEFDILSKDAMIYPKFTPAVARDAQEQTLRTIVDTVLTRKGDYRDIFTTRNTFLTPVMGSVYGVPVEKTTPDMALEDWIPYTYPEGDPRAGILMQISFVALHSHPGRSSPTLRGKALRTLLLCQKVPDPPANVDFTVVQNTDNAQFKTARARLEQHRTNPACAGCHKLIDPMGLAMENFDGSGSFRMKENGEVIDASGELDGGVFKDATGLGSAMHNSPAASSCLVNRTASYGLGRVATKGENEWVKSLEKAFAADGYKLPGLMRRIAMSTEFYRVSAPQTGALDMPASKLASGADLQKETK